MGRYFTKSAIVGTPSPDSSRYLMDPNNEGASITVHEDELETWTGLLNASGEEIHRTERISLGFKVRK